MYGFIILGPVMVFLIPAWEAIFGSLTRNDCRVVNLEKILELKDGKTIFYTNSHGGVHVVTFDENGKHYDLSKSFIEDVPLKTKKNVSDMNYTQYQKEFIKDRNLVLAKVNNGKVDEYILNGSVESVLYKYYIWLFIKTKYLIEDL